ncbi:helix-turn-helix transcriptional regulator [Brucella anthropi]|uniref:helix-turn-helix domain-containing protein n=1 Tax=Brucella anthropi TaxID=529 RepID=UPI00124DCDE6|nr:helix-turn-helix transcriptional regulator [Brucella anthropi]KAB2792560.1 helix-turn-helix transcriptional regulator [Brucella anthropi]
MTLIDRLSKLDGPDSVGETISNRMKDLRKQHKLSLQQVADRAGTSKSHIWDMENGHSKNPTIDMAVSIANALGVSLDYLTDLSTQTPNLHPEALRIACEVDALLRAKEASKS